MQIRLYLGGEL